MKGMVALELGVVRLLAAEARAAGRDPATRPDPGPAPRRPVHVHRGRGGRRQGRRRWIVEHRPEWLRAAGALNECGGVVGDDRPAGGSTRSRSPRRASPPTGSTSAGRGATARCRARTTPRSCAATVIARLAVPGPTRLTPVMARFFEPRPPMPARGRRAARARLAGDDPRRAEAALAAACDPMYARALRALLRDTISPDVVHAGIKYNVIPGEAVDRGRLPGAARDDRAGHAGRAVEGASGRTRRRPARSS